MQGRRSSMAGVPGSPAVGHRGRRQRYTMGGGTGTAQYNDNNNKSTGNAIIRVVVRKRPLTTQELNNNQSDIIHVPINPCTNLFLHEVKTKFDGQEYTDQHKYHFDAVFDQTTHNYMLYQQVCRPLVEAFLQGTTATFFAYGATGSGKSFTMLGSTGTEENTALEINKKRNSKQNIRMSLGGQNATLGLYALAAQDIFNVLYSEGNNVSRGIWVSFYEIYENKSFDLLNTCQSLKILADSKENVHVVGLKQIRCNSVAELAQIVELGLSNRKTGVTGANSDSSRSHAILEIRLKNLANEQQVAKLSFIDLAGSERGADTINSNHKTRSEGAAINTSLLALKECIRAQAKGSAHVPFRQCQLTQVLKDSFVGRTMTVMIVNIAPGNKFCHQTLNSLRYGSTVIDIGQNERNQNSPIMTDMFKFPTAPEPKIPTPLKRSTPTPKKKPIKSNNDNNRKQHGGELKNLHRAHQAVVDKNMDLLQEEIKLIKLSQAEQILPEKYRQNIQTILKKRIEISEKLLELFANLKPDDGCSSTI